MNNFLTNVAARALARTPVLKPRLPSMFEPPPSGFGPAGVRGADFVERSEVIETPAQNGIPDARPAPFAPVETGPALAFERQPRERPGVSHGPPGDIRFERNDADGPGAPSRDGRAAETSVERNPPAPPQALPAPPLTHAAEWRPPPLETPPMPPRRSGNGDASGESSTVSPRPVAREEDRRPTPVSAAPRPVVEKPSVPPADARRDAVRPMEPPGSRSARPEPPKMVPAPARGVEAAPLVHVTIGRVEVRAVADPSSPRTPPPAKQRPAHNALSLDAYLRARHEGGRR